LYADLNPIEKDRDILKDAEKRLSQKLERVKENGIRKYHVHGDGKKKRRKRKGT
jgi:endonuclease IV